MRRAAGHKEVSSRSKEADLQTLTRIHDLSRRILDSSGSQPLLKEIIDSVLEIERSHAAFRQSEKKYRELVENSGSIVLKVDKNLNIIFINEFGLDFFGYASQEIIGKNVIGTIMPRYDHSGRDLGSMATDIICNPHLYESNIHQNMRKNGELVWMSWTNKPVFNKKGELREILSIGNDISKLMQAEEALRKSELKANMIVKYAPAGIYEIDFNGPRFTSVNDFMCEITGYTREEFLSMDPFQLLDEQSRNIFRERIIKVLSGEKVDEHVEYPVLTKDGRTIWADLNVRIMKGIDGSHIALVIAHDITWRRKAGEDLRQSEMKYRALLNASSDIVYRMNKDWTELNYLMGRDYIEDTDEPVTTWLEKYITPEDRDEVRSFITNAVFLKTAFEVEHRIIRKDGNLGWAISRAVPILDNEGNITDWFCMASDITERKITVEKLKELYESLQHSQSNLTLILETGNIGLWEYDLDTGKITTDERIRKILYASPTSGPGSIEDMVNYIHEDDISRVRRDLQTVLTTDGLIETIFRTKPENGDVRYVSSRAIVNKNSEGKPINITGVCFDITEMAKSTEQSLLKLNEELLRSNNDLQQFAYVASHDLQEPLRMVSSFTQLLGQRYSEKLDDDAREFIKFAVEGSKRMYDLLNGLLSYSRVNTRENDFAEISLNAVIGKVLENLKLRIDETNAGIHVDPLPVVSADESQMIQLFQNLLENAIKFSDRTPQIVITSSRTDGFHEIVVRDNGLGIEEAYQEKIFRIFQRLHGSGYQGTGIGLAICRRIVERHGGKIRVESMPGHGSAFIITLPV